VVVALVRADSGDRLQDYFGAEFLSTALTNASEASLSSLPILLSLGLFALSIWAIASEIRQYPPQAILNWHCGDSPLGLGAVRLSDGDQLRFSHRLRCLGDQVCAASFALSSDGVWWR
jgi:hypothetical protein